MAAIAGLPLSPSSTYTATNGSGAATRSRDLTGISNPFNSQSQPPSRIEEQDLSTMRIPPPAPISTSLFDPYAHASRLYTDEEVAHISAALHNHNTSSERANATTPTSFTSTNSGPRYVDPKESAARFRTLDAQLLNDREKVSKHFDDELSDDEGGLPYMS